jgi:hypothetical protein
MGATMKSWKSTVGVGLILIFTLAMSACDNVGVGIGVSYPGAYYGGGTTGPGMVVGGAAYR